MPDSHRFPQSHSDRPMTPPSHHQVVPAMPPMSPAPLPSEPYFSEAMKPKKRDRVIWEVRSVLLQGEFIAAVTTCNNFRPWMVDLIIVTNARLLALAAGGEVKWEIELPDIRWIETDPNASKHDQNPPLLVHTGNEEPLKFKLVPRDGHTLVIGAVNYRRNCALPGEYQADMESRRAQARAHERAKLAALAREWPSTVVKGLTLAKRTSVAVQQHCRPGEQPWFILVADGALAAFEDRLIIVKSSIWDAAMAGALGGGRTATFYYRDINAIEYNSGLMTGVLEVLTASYQGTANKDFWRGSTSSRNADANDPFTLSHTLPLWKGEYQKALPELNELRRRISESKGMVTIARIARETYPAPMPAPAPTLPSPHAVPAPHQGASPMGGSPVPVSGPINDVSLSAPADPSTPAQSKPSAGALVDEIKRLAELWEAGALTDEEFSAAKAKILNF